jgi:hypothetical protein
MVEAAMEAAVMETTVESAGRKAAALDACNSGGTNGRRTCEAGAEASAADCGCAKASAADSGCAKSAAAKATTAAAEATSKSAAVATAEATSKSATTTAMATTTATATAAAAMSASQGRRCRGECYC